MILFMLCPLVEQDFKSFDNYLQVWSVTEEGIYCEQVEEMKDQINNLVVAANSVACYIPQGAGVKVRK